MVRVGISVEGQTEERFIKDTLAPHLLAYQVYLTPVIVATSRSASGEKAKGGGINIPRVSDELDRLLSGFSDGFVTTFYDFYGFEGKYPSETIDALEERILQSVKYPARLIPYVQLHEFEALLFSDSDIAGAYFQSAVIGNLIRNAVAAAGCPEGVNDNPNTAPSKRLKAWTAAHAPLLQRFSNSTKTRHGPQLAARISLNIIRNACPRFHNWLNTLEALGQGVAPPAVAD